MDIISAAIGVVVTVIILSIIVLIHEFGHFITAKMFGIKVEEFGLGFPPKIWSKKRGETLYTINRWPIGGFVKLYGEDEAGAGRIDLKNDESIKKEDVDRAFFARPIWQRAVVVLAGVVMNTLLAFFVYYIFLFLSDFKTILPLYAADPQNVYTPSFSNVKQVTRPAGVYIEDVSRNSPAEKAGIKTPARVVSVNNEQITDKEEGVQKVIKLINSNKGKEITITWSEAESGRSYSAKVTPRTNTGKNEGPLGVALNYLPVSLIVLNYETPQQKVLSGITHPINLMKYNFDIMKIMIANAVTNNNITPLSKGVSGPVAIVGLGAEINKIPDIKEKIMQFLNLAGLISISLAFFNVLPIPALDGGRLLFILIEGVIGKKVSPKLEAAIHTAGMVVLMALILLVTFKDIFQFFSPAK